MFLHLSAVKIFGDFSASSRKGRNSEGVGGRASEIGDRGSGIGGRGSGVGLPENNQTSLATSPIYREAAR